MPRYLTVAQFAAATGVPVRTVQDRCRRGVYRCRLSKGRYQIVASEVERELLRAA